MKILLLIINIIAYGYIGICVVFSTICFIGFYILHRRKKKIIDIKNKLSKDSVIIDNKSETIN
jgi:hypothetical protein